MVREPGASAPKIRAHTADGGEVHTAFEGAAVVHFVPPDDERGAAGFGGVEEPLRTAGVSVYAVAPRHEGDERWFDRLLDPDGTLADAFGVPVTDGAPERVTFVVVGGTIRGVYEGVRPAGHAADVVRDLAEIGLVER